MIELQIIGNLGKDAEMKTISGNNYASFSVAITEKRNGQDVTTWVSCMKMDKDGNLTKYLKKGKKVLLRGRPSVGAYTNQRGEMKADITLWANDLVFLGGGQREEQKWRGEQQERQSEDDLPF